MKKTFLAACAAALAWMALLPRPMTAQGCSPTDQIARVSVSSAGVQANAWSYTPDISGAGRYVAFSSSADTLVSGDTNAAEDIFVYDRTFCQTQRVSVSSGGDQADADSFLPAFSADGRRLTFESEASNLVLGDTLAHTDIFQRNVPNSQTERISLNVDGDDPNGDSLTAATSGDGRYVVFESLATDLVPPGDPLAFRDVFVRDRLTSSTALISVSTTGTHGSGDSTWASISEDGRYVAFQSAAADLIAADGNAVTDIFVRDRQTNQTTRINGVGGAAPNGNSSYPVISGDGRYVAFVSAATNLAAGETPTTPSVYLHDRNSGTTLKISANGVWAFLYPDLSRDGRFLVYAAHPNPIPGSEVQVYLYDRVTGETVRVSSAANGAAGNGSSGNARISADGTTITFASEATNLVANDTNAAADIFVVPRWALSSGGLLSNGDFDAGFAGWGAFGAPNASDIVHSVSGGVLTFHRAAGSESAVVLQNTGIPAPVSAGLDLQIEIGSASAARKRVTLLLHDSDFTDLQVCTFWLLPNQPLSLYRMTARTTEAWANVTVSIYASSADGLPGYQIDNASLKLNIGPSSSRVMCHDPNAPAATPEDDSAEWLTNGDFANQFAGWSQFFSINTQVNSGVLEFQGTGTPTGVVFQETANAAPAGSIIEATFTLGSSAPRRRLTVLLRDADFTDLQVCTFWLAANAPLQVYTMRAYTTEAWTGASISFYPSTPGTTGWYRVDTVSMRARPNKSIVGTECYPPGTAPADLGGGELDPFDFSAPPVSVAPPLTEPPSAEGAITEGETLPLSPALPELPLAATPTPLPPPDSGAEGSISE